MSFGFIIPLRVVQREEKNKNEMDGGTFTRVSLMMEETHATVGHDLNCCFQTLETIKL